MPKKQYQVQLTGEERSSLISLLKKGTIAARKLARAQILRLADAGKQDAEIAESVGAGLATVESTRKKYKAAVVSPQCRQ